VAWCSEEKALRKLGALSGHNVEIPIQFVGDHCASYICDVVHVIVIVIVIVMSIYKCVFLPETGGNVGNIAGSSTCLILLPG